MSNKPSSVRVSMLVLAISAGIACTAELGSLAPDQEARLDIDAGAEKPREAGVADSGPRANDSGQSADSTTPTDAAPGLPCDGVASGGTQTTLGYADALVSPPALCEQGDQTRTCVNGMWTAFVGDFPFHDCTVEGFLNCDGTPHGGVETNRAYTRSSAATATQCAAAAVSETRTCNDGTWGAWSGLPAGALDACVVAPGGACSVLGDLSAFQCAEGTCSLLRGLCVYAPGASCTTNAECDGACINQVCSAQHRPLGTCDDADDCTGCSSSAQCVAGVCKCNDSSFCGSNAACVHTCRGGFCAPTGVACDANDQVDCGAANVCGLASGFWLCYGDIGDACTNDNQCEGSCQNATGSCALMSLLGGPCDNDHDCDDSASICSAGRCTRDKGEACTVATDCASGECVVKLGGGACK